jgi:hypothetical protein
MSAALEIKIHQVACAGNGPPGESIEFSECMESGPKKQLKLQLW